MGLLASHRDNSVKITYPENIYHEEKKAPTDESIRLFNEFRKEALDSILEKILVKDNNIEYTFVVTDYCLMPQYHFKIKINGVEYIKSYDYQKAHFDTEKTIDDIVKWIAEMISRDFINELIARRELGYRNFICQTK